MWLLFFYLLSLFLFRCGYFSFIHFHLPYSDVATFLVFTFFRVVFFSLIHFHFSYSDVVTFLVSGNSWRNLDTSSQSTSIDLTSDASEAYYHTKKNKNKCYFTKIHISFHDVKTSLCHRLPGTGGCCRWCKPYQEVNNFKKFNCVMSNLNHK